MPIWDSYVLKAIGLKPTYSGDPKRIEKTIALYEKLQEWYEVFLKTEDARILINLFTEKYSNYQISDIKKIDFILWQMR